MDEFMAVLEAHMSEALEERVHVPYLCRDDDYDLGFVDGTIDALERLYAAFEKQRAVFILSV